MDKIFIEENGIYSIDCTNALWATNKIHDDYHNAGLQLKNADFLIENDTEIYIVEYKNACISIAENAGAFKPADEKKLYDVVHKFYDSLHYLSLLDKTKPVWYVYILEYPNGDIVTRKRLRDRMKRKLPFKLQENVGNGKKLIEAVDVVSIKEWNEDENYGKYPIILLNQ